MIKSGLVLDSEVLRNEEASPHGDLARVIANAPKTIDAWLIGFLMFSLTISLGFFWEGTKADFSSLSGDQVNILTVAAKKDRPHLLQGDLVAGDTRSIDYYIPVFVSLVRLFSLPNYNYLRGLNLLLLLTSLIYMLGWWVLFCSWGDKWIAAILAFLVRGVMWPPGNELWGIAGLGSMLPRTLFLALLPWVLWLWFRRRHTRRGWLLTCFACGLLVNIHPISGVGIVVALLFGELGWSFAESKDFQHVLVRLCLGVLLISVGMAPFVWTYVSMLASTQGVDPNELYQAMRMRIGPIFWDPLLYLRRWLRPKWLMLILLPFMLLPLLGRRNLAVYRNQIIALAGFSLGCVFAAFAPFLAERIMKTFGYEVRFAFQLVRTGKYLMIPSLILMALLLTVGWRYLASCLQYRRAGMVTATCLVLLLTFVSRHSAFDRVPLMGDDVVRFLWPSMGKPRQLNASSTNLDGILKWIEKNTSENARFVGPRLIRPGALRPVIYDFSGAGMLIEGNPREFVEAIRRKKQLAQPEYNDIVKRSQLFASWGADYWMTKAYIPSLRLVHLEAGWFIYDLRTNGK